MDYQGDIRWQIFRLKYQSNHKFQGGKIPWSFELYRRLIPKIAFMHFLAILTFLHIWKDKSQGYLKMQGPWQFLQTKGV